MTTPLDIRPPIQARRTDISSDPTVDGTDTVPAAGPGADGTDDVESLAHIIARAGIDALTDHHLDLIERAARAVGVRPVLVEILLDTSQAEVTRARAYGRIITKVMNAAWATTATHHDGAEPTVLGHPPETDTKSVNTGGSGHQQPPKDPS